jgi:hypothetical protein
LCISNFAVQAILRGDEEAAAPHITAIEILKARLARQRQEEAAKS